MMKSDHRIVVYVLVIYIALVAREALATKHVVNWDLSSDFKSLAKKQTFKVGDQLVFQYTSGLHSVVELSTEKEYKDCDTSNVLDSMSTGSDTIKLTKTGTRYFACGTAGHCDQGMKLKVKVVAADEASTPDQDSSPTSSSTSTPTTSTDSTPTTTSITSAVVGVQSFVSFLLVSAAITISLLF